MQSFSELGVPARIVRALSERDIHTPFPIQEGVLRDALAGRDILAKAPTGSGKTLSFAIPLVERLDLDAARPSALVLVPTRELASQVAVEVASLAPKGVEVATVYGGVPVHTQAKRARRAHVLVATPGRLNDLLERKAISLDGVTTLILDEADRMLDMGFKPQVDRIVRRLPRARQTMFFSATLDANVGELARAYTSDPVRCDVAPVVAEDGVEVEHRFVAVKPDDKGSPICCRKIEASRSSSCVRGAARTGSSRSSPSTRSTRSPCTET
jgi:ATP-dependent RNA helicase RhlE